MTTDELEARIRAAGHHVTLASLVNERTAAAALDVHARTLRRWRIEGRGPPHLRRSGRAWYSTEALARWLSGDK